MDLSKCTELVGGCRILYGPERTSQKPDKPWSALIEFRDGSWDVYYYTDAGSWYKHGDRSSFDLKLPEPEWVYVGPNLTPDVNAHMFPFMVTTMPHRATHRYQAGKPETMERVDEA